MPATCASATPTIIHLSSPGLPERQALADILERAGASSDKSKQAEVLVVWAEDFFRDLRIVETVQQIRKRGSKLVVIYTLPSRDELERTQEMRFRMLPDDHVAFDAIIAPTEAIIDTINQAIQEAA